MPQRSSLKVGVLLAALTFGVTSCSTTPKPKPPSPTAAPVSARQRTSLDADWSFHLGDLPTDQASAAAFDDSQWKHVDVPHDYVLDGTYLSTKDRNHGYLPVDIGWYRKRLAIPETLRGKTLSLVFDGVYRDAQVWLNGQPLGKHAGGYTPFSVDVTGIVKPGEENVLAVRVNPHAFEGWWYEGGGIYRHVSLLATDPLHVAQFGTYVTSIVPDGDKGADEKADVTIQTTVENKGAADERYRVASEILDSAGRLIQGVITADASPARGAHDVVQHATIAHPALWSTETPALYTLRTTILRDGKAVDTTTTQFGVRTIRFDADKGFFLNGKRVEIQGVCCHQDFAGVGIAVPDSLQPWRVEQVKKAGANAWRTAHNPPSEALLDACDRLGLLVMDENRHLGDSYKAKSPHGTGTDDLSDLSTMIRRDRNHPAIVLWSMCNEEDLQGTPEAASIVSAMMKATARLDDTRPITAAMNGNGGESIFLGHGIADVEDVIGVNYNYVSFDTIHKRHPDKPMFGSEDLNQKNARGEYVENRAAGFASSYALSDDLWQLFAARPYMAGAFIWTGFDYKGEPNPFGWPDVANNTGLLDSAGFPKDRFHYFKSVWTSEPMVHLLPSAWNAPINPPGIPTRVVAFSNAQQVELFLNGSSLGRKEMPHAGHLDWLVPFQPGDLTAKAYTNGKLVATDIVQTTGKPVRIELTTGRKKLGTDGEDAVVVAATLLDDRGRVVPDSANRVTFHLTGPGKLLGVGNGNPADHDSDRADNRQAFHGKCIAVIEAGTNAGSLSVTATAPGLSDGTVTFDVR